jgi:spore germination protein GerM
MAGSREALLELLKGPGQAEGLSTEIPQGTTLRKCDVLEDGTAKVDFSREILNFGGGSARITAIIDQITKTVQANDPAVRTVAITVEGQPAEEVLQP